MNTFVDYNKYDNLDMFAYNCLSYLIDNNENIWKMLYYEDASCLSRSNITLEQKRNLIYNGQPDSSLFRVFIEGGNNDAFTQQCSMLRIYPAMVIPENRVIGVVSIMFECLSHYKIGTIENISGYSSRSLSMIKELIQTLNGQDIGGVGVLSLDKSACPYNKIQYNLSNDRSFFGYSMLMSVRIG